MIKILKWLGLLGANGVLCYNNLGPFDGWEWWVIILGFCLWKAADAE